MKSNDRQPMSYIICSRKKSRPKVSQIVCENCKRMRKCQDYKDHLQPSLFPDFMKTQPPFKRRRHTRRLGSKTGDHENRTVQLIFNFQ